MQRGDPSVAILMKGPNSVNGEQNRARNWMQLHCVKDTAKTPTAKKTTGSRMAGIFIGQWNAVETEQISGYTTKHQLGFSILSQLFCV